MKRLIDTKLTKMIYKVLTGVYKCTILGTQKKKKKFYFSLVMDLMHERFIS